MEKYGQRVAAARDHAKLSQGELARALKVTQSAISQLEAGNATGSKHSFKIAQITGVRVQWLEENSGAMLSPPGTQEDPQPFRRAETAAIDVRAMPRDMPVLGSAACGDDGLFELQGETLDYLRRPPRLIGVKDAYAIYCSNDSMSPWREHGDPVYVNPNQPPKPGDYVCVQLHPEGPGKAIPAYIKKLVRRTERDLKLWQFNPAKELMLPMKRVWHVHRIIDWNELLGF